MNLCIDVETSKLPRAFPWQPDSYLVSIHAATSKGRVYSWLVNHPEATQTHLQIQQEVQELVDRSNRIIGHNFKFDYNWLLKFGIHLSNRIYCTQVAEYILKLFRPSRSLSLDACARRYGIPTKLDIVKQYWDSDYETDEIPAKILKKYGEQDCLITLRVFMEQITKIKERNIQPLISLEMETMRYLAEAEYNGMAVDSVLLSDYSNEYTNTITTIDTQLTGLVGEDISFSSGDQLSAALYGGSYKVDGVEETERTLKDGTVKKGSRKTKVEQTHPGLGFTPLPNTETKKAGVYKTDAPTISQLKPTTKAGKEFLKLYQERAKLSTLLNTFFNGLLKRMLPDKTVHPTINQTVTRTGRLSCSNPNLQNLPRGNTGPVKKCFRSKYED